MDLLLFYIPFKGKERPAKTKLMPAILCAVLACGESHISRISPRLSGAQVGLIHERKKKRDTAILRYSYKLSETHDKICI